MLVITSNNVTQSTTTLHRSKKHPIIRVIDRMTCIISPLLPVVAFDLYGVYRQVHRRYSESNVSLSESNIQCSEFEPSWQRNGALK